MPRVTDIDVFEKNAQPTLYIRATTSVDKLPQLIGESYGKLAAYLKEQGAYLADMPYVAYYNMDMQNLDVEMGLPLAKALPGKEEIAAGSIPAGKSVFSIHRGPYAEMEPMYMEMEKWIADNGFTATGTVYEHYLNGPDFPESEMLTMVVMPLA